MSDRSTIEWTDASWNPVRGCALVSPGCTNCYAMKQAHRFSRPGKAYAGLTKMTKAGPVWTGKVTLHPELLDWPLRKKKPLRIFVNSMSDLFHEDVPDSFITEVWKRMADAPQHIFQILTKRPQRARDYLLPRLTVGNSVAEPLSNVWLGVSIEDQAHANERIPLLLQTPAAVRWISAEPQLGAMDVGLYLGPTGYTLGNPEVYEPYLSADPLPAKRIGGAWFSTVEAATAAIVDGCLPRAWFPDRKLPALVYELRGGAHDDSTDEVGAGRLTQSAPLARVGAPRLDWVVVGGESGPGARPFDIAWARSLRDQCKAAGVPFFLKQIGRYPFSNRDEGYPWAQLYDEKDVALQEWGLFDSPSSKGGDPAEWPDDLRVREYPA